MIHLENRGSTRLLRLENGKVNALEVDLLEALSREVVSFRESTSKALVITGTGKSFSGGLDLAKILEGGTSYIEKLISVFSMALKNLFTTPKPVVAAINGHAVAGGCVIVAACDYRIMSQGVGTIGLPELLLGVPFPALALEVMRSVIAPQFFEEAVFTGKNYSTGEAIRRGFVHELVNPERLLDYSFEQAEKLAAVVPQTYQLSKQQIRQTVLDRAEHTSKLFDSKTSEIWKSETIPRAIKEYLERIASAKKG